MNTMRPQEYYKIPKNAGGLQNYHGAPLILWYAAGIPWDYNNTMVSNNTMGIYEYYGTQKIYGASLILWDFISTMELH